MRISRDGRVSVVPALLMRNDVATLNVQYAQGLRTLGASLFKIALLVGRLCSANRGEELSTCQACLDGLFLEVGDQVTGAWMGA